MSRNTRILFILGYLLMAVGFYIYIFHFEDAYFIPGVTSFLIAIFLVTFSSVRGMRERKMNGK